MSLPPSPTITLASPDAYELAPVRTQVLSDWGEHMSRQVLSLQAQSMQPSEYFSGQASIARFHRCVVADIRASAHRVMRTRSQMSADKDRYFKVIWQQEGCNQIEHKGHSITIAPGQWSIYDTSHPYSVDTSDGSRFLVLLLPVSEMGRWNPGIEFAAGKVLPTQGTAEIARLALSGMLSSGMALEQDGAVVMQDSVSALIGNAVTHIYGQTSPAQDGAVSRRLRKAQACIEDRLTDPSLSPDDIAVACGMSRRSLYAAFNALGQTPNSYVLQRRLTVAAERLGDPGLRTTITQVAFEMGFSDAAHFSRVFSDKFGQTPSQWRQRHLLGR